MIRYKTIYDLYSEWSNNEELPVKIIMYDNGEVYYRVKNGDLNCMYQNKCGHLLSFTNEVDKWKTIICYYSINILDETEKKYLESVIKPFRNKIIHIAKYSYSVGEYISICYKDTNKIHGFINLPSFKSNTMYKGMEIGREYSLKELGI